MKILLLLPYPESVAPSQRLKFEQYYNHWQENGIELTKSSFISKSFWKIIYQKGYFFSKIFYTISGYLTRIFDLIRIRNYDVVYVHLWVVPFGPPIFEWLVSKLAKKLIYDIDDLVYLKPKSKNNPLIQILKSSNNPIVLMKNADHVITCTPYLDQFVRQYNAKTTDISSTINTETYQVKIKAVNKEILLGWSGSFSTSKYVNLLEPILKKLELKYDIKLLIIGDPNFKINGIDIEAISWNEATEVIDLQRIDIGLYPLPDEEWVLGKSGLKALQYMALGIPTVATGIGANFRVIENGVSGFLCKNDNEWYDTLSRLIENKSLRNEIGIEARKRVENMYSINANQEKYFNIINN